MVNTTLHAAMGRFVYSQLLAATTYGAELRAINPRGSSRWSERIVATTRPPSHLPYQPSVPTLVVGGHTCDVQVIVQLPNASASTCAGAESVELQALRAGSTTWRSVRGRGAEISFRLGSSELTGAAAYKFRVLAFNRFGASSAGAASKAIVAGLSMAAHLRPPVVRATSSASFAISLPMAAVPCLESLSWTVMVRIVPHGWRVLGTGGQGTTYNVERLRCPVQPSGCEFKLRPDVHSFGPSDFDGPSTFIPNLNLHAVPAGAVRIELQLRGSQWSGLDRAALTVDLTARLRMREEPVVVEAHASRGDVFVVVDLPHWSREAAQTVAQELVNQLGVEPASRDGEHQRSGVWDRIDRNTGVLQQIEDGEWLLLPPDPRYDQRTLPQAYFQAGLVFLCMVFCVALVRRFQRVIRRLRDLQGAIPLATSEEEAEIVEAQRCMPSMPTRSADDGWPT